MENNKKKNDAFGSGSEGISVSSYYATLLKQKIALLSKLIAWRQELVGDLSKTEEKTQLTKPKKPAKVEKKEDLVFGA